MSLENCSTSVDWLAYATGRSGRQTTITFREVESRIVSNVAIVTGINEIRGTGARDADDKTELTLRFTQVWIRSDGRWLREAFQATPISMAVAS